MSAPKLPMITYVVLLLNLILGTPLVTETSMYYMIGPEDIFTEPLVSKSSIEK